MAWTDDRVERLKKLWAEGRSASQIAKELGEVTRNAVIGKVHRLGISERASVPRPVRAAKRARPASRQRARPRAANSVARRSAESRSLPRRALTSVVPTKKIVVLGDPVSLLELTEKLCKWPVGDPDSADFRFCGNPSEHGVSYCVDHQDLAYQPASSRRDRERERRIAKRSVLLG